MAAARRSHASDSFLPPLTGVRAIAALMVYLHHFTPPIAVGAMTNILKEFHVGVTVFFVLSGFLIPYRYYDGARLDRRWFLHYMRLRVARIYPVYLLLTVVSIVAYKLTDPFELFINLTLTKGLFSTYRFSLISQSWSLTVEECFYLSAPLIFVCAKRRLLWLPCLTIPAFGLALVQLHLPRTFMESIPFMLLYTYFGRFFEFLCGIGLALLLKRDSARLKTRAIGGPLLTYGGLILLLAGISIMAQLEPTAAVLTGVRSFGNFGLFSPGGIVLNNFVLPICITVLFAGLIVERTWLAALLGSPPLVLLGKSSYIFYLIHLGVIHDLISKRVTHSYGLVLLALVGVSIVLFKAFEEPVNRLLRGRDDPLVATPLEAGILEAGGA